MNVLAICATKGRHRHVEKLVRFFLNQDYVNPHTLLIYNNSSIEQTLANIDLPEHKKIILINNYIDSLTGKPYKSLGGVYNDAIKMAPEADLVCHWDDDDAYMPNHITKGVEGYIKGKKKAYKPERSFYFSQDGLSLENNVLEPSIFVEYNHVKEYGYKLTNSNSHYTWLLPLIDTNEIFVDPEGEATFIYDWSGLMPAFKTSGDTDSVNNFNNYENYSTDHGDQIITPGPVDYIESYYDFVKRFKNQQ
jgi:hypothetical protein